MNPSASLLEGFPAGRRALVAIDRSGVRSEWSFGDVRDGAARLAGRFASLGVGRGDVVLTVLGSTPEWALSMLATWRLGAVSLPCHEMLTELDLEHRIEASDPKLIVTHPEHVGKLEAVAGGRQLITAPEPGFLDGVPVPAVELATNDPAVIIFTSGTTSKPKGIVHGVRWIEGQRLQAAEWFAAEPETVAWCTAAPGWSKSARNAFLAPWFCGATALLHAGRFDPEERIAIVERERVATLCQAPTEFRVMAASGALRRVPGLDSLVAAGEALGAELLDAVEELTGVRIRDGYGQTETNHLTAVRPGDAAPPGSMGRALSGISLELVDGELVVDPATVPTFFVSELGGPPAPTDRPWHTGDLVREEDGWLFFEGRADDVIGSAGYRIGPLEVESALSTHPAVAESAVVGHPDEERGEVVRAIVVLRDGHTASTELAEELRLHVRSLTAPYKQPRIVEFADSLPRTDSGKVRRSALRKR